MEYKLINKLLNIYEAQKALSTIFQDMKTVSVYANMRVSLSNKHFTFNP